MLFLLLCFRSSPLQPVPTTAPLGTTLKLQLLTFILTPLTSPIILSFLTRSRFSKSNREKQSNREKYLSPRDRYSSQIR